MRKLSLAALTALELTPVELIECAYEAGFDAVGLRLIPATPTEKSYDFRGDTAIRRECIKALKETGIQVEDLEIVRVLPETKIQDLEYFFESGAELGGKSVLVAADDDNQYRLIQNLGELADLSRKYGILPHIEYMPWLKIATLKDAVQIVNLVGHKNLSVLIDTFHTYYSHSDLNDWKDYIGTAPRYVQLCDVPTVTAKGKAEIINYARGSRRAPGEGHSKNLADVLKLLDSQTAISLEIPESEYSSVPALDRTKRLIAVTRQWLADNDLN